jgi:bifunctional non-homologous end joining protein LigD
LISLAQIGALELHPWGSRADRLDQPDRLIFDLDPAPDVDFGRVVQAAKLLRRFLQDLGLETFARTTGGKGIHLVAPVRREAEWPEAKAFCRRVAEAVVAADPGQFTSVMSKAKRTGKIFVDYLRNDRGSTAIASYSPRARPGATVATPLAWSELTARLRPEQFTVRTIAARLKKLKRDPWAGLAKHKQRLGPAIKALEAVGIVEP